MTPRLTFFNVAIVGLLQIGVVVGGVLGAGSVCKVVKETHSAFHASTTTQFAADYGLVVLLVPLLWVTVAMAIQSRNQDADAPEILTFVSGIGVLLLLLIGAAQAAFIPLVNILSPSSCMVLST